MHMHRHTFIRVTHFSHFILLSFRPRRPLVNMIFLNSYLLARARAPSLCYIPLFLLFCRISFQSLISLVLMLVLSFPLPRLYSFLFFSSLSPRPIVSVSFCFFSVLCQSNSHSFVFIFPSAPLFRAPPSLFALPLYCTSSPCPVLHYHFLVSFFHFVFSHGLHCTLSTPSISSIHTATRAPRWIFILCVSYLHMTGLGLKWLKSSIVSKDLNVCVPIKLTS